jgi:hypothetical protein
MWGDPSIFCNHDEAKDCEKCLEISLVHVIEKSAYSYAVEQWDYWVDEARKAQAEVERLRSALVRAKEQRDGYRNNYWAIVKPCASDCADIIESNNAELEKLERGE